MRLDKLTSHLQEALGQAQSLAVGQDNPSIEPLHVMKVLLDDESGSIRHLLALIGVNVAELLAKINDALKKLPQIEGGAPRLELSDELIRIFNRADKLSQQRKDTYISSELFVLAALEESSSNLSRLLKEAQVDKTKLEKAIAELRGGQTVSDQEAESKRQALQKYTVDLTERAAKGKLDPVIGRDDIIRRTIQVLQRRTKNNPVLIGEPGVGKTAIVEGLA